MTMPDPKDGAEPAGAWAQSAKLAFRFLFLAVCLAAIGWSVSNFRQVPPESRAIVYRFGSIVRQQGAGLLMAWPRPIEQVVILPSEDRQIEFRIDQFEPDSAVGGDFMISDYARENTAFLLTGDASVVHLQATLLYQIIDPAAYILAAEHVGPALQRLFVASAVLGLRLARSRHHPGGAARIGQRLERGRARRPRAAARRSDERDQSPSGRPHRRGREPRHQGEPGRSRGRDPERRQERLRLRADRLPAGRPRHRRSPHRRRHDGAAGQPGPRPHPHRRRRQGRGEGHRRQVPHRRHRGAGERIARAVRRACSPAGSITTASAPCWPRRRGSIPWTTMAASS